MLLLFSIIIFNLINYFFSFLLFLICFVFNKYFFSIFKNILNYLNINYKLNSFALNNIELFVLCVETKINTFNL